MKKKIYIHTLVNPILIDLTQFVVFYAERYKKTNVLKVDVKLIVDV